MYRKELILRPGIGPAVERPMILFDLGNILVHLHDVDVFWQGQAAPAGSVPYAQRWAVSPAVRALETGQISDFAEFYWQAKSEMEFSMSLAEFKPAFTRIIGDVFDETHAMLKALYSRFPLMLLSNTSEIHWQYCRDQQKLGGYFDQVFLSYQLGSMKPDPSIYRQMLHLIDNIPENIYYFDDRKDNVDMAIKFGINAQLSWGGPIIIRQLHQLGFIE